MAKKTVFLRNKGFCASRQIAGEDKDSRTPPTAESEAQEEEWGVEWKPPEQQLE